MTTSITYALIGSIFGFIASNGAQWFHDLRQRHYERRTIRNAILSEIEFLVQTIEERPFLGILEYELYLLEANKVEKLVRPSIVIIPELPIQEPVFESQLPRLGLIDKHIVADVVKFHRILSVLKADQRSLHKYNRDAQKVALKYHIELLNQAVQIGKKLLAYGKYEPKSKGL